MDGQDEGTEPSEPSRGQQQWKALATLRSGAKGRTKYDRNPVRTAAMGGRPPDWNHGYSRGAEPL